MRVGILVACEALGAEPPTSELRTRFLQLLQQPSIMDLVGTVSHIEPGAQWTPYAGRGRTIHEAVLTAANIQDKDSPTASALLLLPDTGTSSFGRDPRFAELVIDIELRKPDGSPIAPAPIAAWHDSFEQVFGLPETFRVFLSGPLTLTTSADPPAQLGVWLKTPHAIQDLVDIDGLHPVPGSIPVNWFIGFALADPLGKPAHVAAADLLGQMCDYTLHLDGYEPLLAKLVSHDTP